MAETHVHDCTGLDQTCPCGFIFRVPPICVSIEVFDRNVLLVNEAFNCETVDGAIAALRTAADTLERGSMRSPRGFSART